MSEKEDTRLRRSIWTFTLCHNIDTFEKTIQDGFPFNDFLYCIMWENDGYLRGCLQLCNRNRMSKIKSVLQAKALILLPANTWHEAVDGLEDPVCFGTYVDDNEKISNAKLAKGGSLVSLAERNKRERIVAMREQFLATDNEDATRMDIYKTMPCSNHEAEIAMKQAKLQKKLDREESMRQEASHQILRPWQKEDYHSYHRNLENRFEKDIQDILKGQRDYKSAVKLSQVIGSQIRSNDSHKPPTPKKEDLTDFFEPLYHRKVKYLVSQLEDHGIEWTDSKELVLSNGAIIHHSNIVDLIKEALVGSKKQRRTIPTGWNKFLKVLSALNFPHNFFPKRTTSRDLEKMQKDQEWETY